MATTQERVATFSVDLSILEELGERLVSRPDIALAELIKNAHDADAVNCEAHLNRKQNRLILIDDGVGMTADQFLHRWMRIGTTHKATSRTSPKYGRPFAGSKGIGRFASRFLGQKLTLISIAQESSGRLTKLKSTFKWEASVRNKDIEFFKVPYSVTDAPDQVTGTTLIIEGGTVIEGLYKQEAKIASQVFQLTNPLRGLEQPDFWEKQEHQRQERLSDPGFSTTFSGDWGQSSDKHDGASTDSPNVQSELLSQFVGRSRIEIRDGHFSAALYWRDSGKVYEKKWPISNFYADFPLSTPVLVDIRYFPNRKGTFTQGMVDGRLTKSWVSDRSGVAIIDNGFRIPPFGQPGDDWLAQSLDESTSRRKWRSEPAQKLFPIPPEARSRAADNPALYLPKVGQVIGAAFIASRNFASNDPDSNLIQSIDREGLVRNRAYYILNDITRFALELIAQFDHQFVREAEQRKYEQDIAKANADFEDAIRTVDSAKHIAQPAKTEIVSQLRSAQKRIESSREHEERLRESLSHVALLGIMAGFLTHEFEKVVLGLGESIAILKGQAKASLAPAKISKLEDSYNMLRSYMGYSRLFVDQAAAPHSRPFYTKSQIKRVVKTFAIFSKEHNIQTDCSDCADVQIIGVPIAAFSGIVMNLFTNALKSIIAKRTRGQDSVRITLVQADGNIEITVSDTGIGVPSTLKERIWDPMFSTTRMDNDDTGLGSGMGLGLTLTKNVVENLKGKIELRETPATGYSTTFLIRLPRKLPV